MIDLHCHLLPGIDDGPEDLATSLEMARIAAADGIRVVACTPHVYPGLYENDTDGIAAAIASLQQVLVHSGIDLQLTIGADAHLSPGLLGRLKNGSVPTLAGSRYLLLEPPHNSVPPRFDEAVFELMAAGYVPVITHPERLSWIEDHYPTFARLVKAGAWMQLTAGSLTGRFGKRPRYWAERMLEDGLTHVIATDSHRAQRRPPLLAEAREAAARRLGANEASLLVEERPRWVLENLPADQERMPDPARSAEAHGLGMRGFLQRLRWRA